MTTCLKCNKCIYTCTKTEAHEEFYRQQPIQSRIKKVLEKIEQGEGECYCCDEFDCFEHGGDPVDSQEISRIMKTNNATLKTDWKCIDTEHCEWLENGKTSTWIYKGLMIYILLQSSECNLDDTSVLINKKPFEFGKPCPKYISY
jgi:hypothetical protein